MTREEKEALEQLKSELKLKQEEFDTKTELLKVRKEIRAKKEIKAAKAKPQKFQEWAESCNSKIRFDQLRKLHEKDLELFRELYEGKFEIDLDGETIQTKPDFTDVAEAASYAFEAVRQQQETINTVANKFLPFIVESSTPLNIFKTLLSRSKGMNRVLVASIFNLTLSIEIKKLRETVKNLPELPLEKLYEELMIKYEQYRVPEHTLQLFENLPNFIPAQEDGVIWSEELDQFESKDIMMFFCVMSTSNSMNDYSNLPWDQVADASVRSDVFTKLQDFIVLADSGNKVYVKDETDLAAFVMAQVKLLPHLPGYNPPETFCIEMGDQS